MKKYSTAFLHTPGENLSVRHKGVVGAASRTHQASVTLQHTGTVQDAVVC